MAKPFLKLAAVVVSQPIGAFFLCSIPASALLKLTYSIPASMKRKEGMFSGIFGNQRTQSKIRAKQIGAYLDEDDSTFPNSIILSANYFEDGSYVDDENICWYAKEEDDGCSFLIIPTEERLASIIDGQHRLAGFEYAQKPDRMDMRLPCTIFINLPRANQARIFATININQKKVDKSLAYELFGYDLNESSADKWPPDMLGVYLARILEGNVGSPFKEHIKLALLEEDEEFYPEDNHDVSWHVSVACIVEGISRLISEKPGADRSALASGKVSSRAELPTDNAPLRDLYIAGRDKTLLELVTAYFEVVDELLWKNQEKKSFITRTVGVLALFDVFRDALRTKGIDTKNVPISARTLFLNARGINFADDFFHASGAGRVRIRNVLKVLVGLPSEPDPSTVAVVNRLVANRKT